MTEGRGTEAPFTLVGASWLTDHVAMVAQLNAMHLPGVRFDTATRTIDAGYKFAGQTIPMIHIRVTDRNTVRPIEVGMHLLRAFYVRHPRDFIWRQSFVDRLAGTDQLRSAVEAGTIDALIATWNRDAARFTALVKPYLLYP